MFRKVLRDIVLKHILKSLPASKINEDVLV